MIVHVKTQCNTKDWTANASQRIVTDRPRCKLQQTHKSHLMLWRAGPGAWGGISWVYTRVTRRREKLNVWPVTHSFYLTDSPIEVTTTNTNHSSESTAPAGDSHSEFYLAAIQTDPPTVFICFTTTTPSSPSSSLPHLHLSFTSPSSLHPPFQHRCTIIFLFLNAQDACIPSIQHHTHVRACK